MIEEEGYEVAKNGSLEHWYVVHRQWKGTVFHRTILEEQYDSENAAEEAANVMRSVQG